MWVASVTDPKGREVVLLVRIWDDKIRVSHPDLHPSRTRFYKRNVGPSRWLVVVVSFEQEPARIITAVANRRGGGVLYLHIGSPQPGEGEETAEGQVLRFAPGTQRIVGLTLINARYLVERDGHVVIAVPDYALRRQILSH